MPHSRVHKTRSKSKHRKKRGFERFFQSRLPIVSGVLFLLAGLYYLISSSDSEGSVSFIDMFRSFLSPSDDAPVMLLAAGEGFLTLALLFLPALIGLTVTGYYATRYKLVTYPVSIIISIYLIVIQAKTLITDLMAGVSTYPNIFISILFLLLPIVLVIVNSKLHHRFLLLLLSCFYFYVSFVLNIIDFNPYRHFFIFSILLFSSLLAWVARKIHRPTINLINFFFAYFFLGMFWFRKFVVNSKTDSIMVFFLLGICFYLVFYAITLYASNSRERSMRKWMQLVITWLNLVFFAGSTSYVIIKFYSFGYLWLFAIALLLVNLLGLFLQKRYKWRAWTLPHHYVSLALAALVLPLLLQQNMVILFTAGLSVIMLVYAVKFKDRTAMLISLLSMGAMTISFIFRWSISYLPSLFSKQILIDNSLLGHGVVSGVVTGIALLLIIWKLNDEDNVIPLSKEWFSRTAYSRFIRSFLLVIIFLTSGWIGYSLLVEMTGTVLYTPLIWFISGSLFFIILINFYSGNQSKFKKPILYLAATFTLFYPLLVHWSMINFRESIIHLKDINGIFLFFHFSSLVLMIILGTKTIKRIYRQNTKYVLIQKLVQVLTVIYLLFLICSEYDNLSVIVAVINNQSTDTHAIAIDILTLNQYLPYSVIMWSLTLSVFLWSVVYHNKFLRNFSIVFYLLVLLKLFAYDFNTLGLYGRSAVFFSVGLFFIGLALLYPRIKPEPKVIKRKHHRTRSSRHSKHTIEPNMEVTSENVPK
jgi:hypothetical protein